MNKLILGLPLLFAIYTLHSVNIPQLLTLSQHIHKHVHEHVAIVIRWWGLFMDADLVVLSTHPNYTTMYILLPIIINTCSAMTSSL